ncbi:MAG: tRNA (N(6)-L-threonylcarbamoyladenosine(37)-C(2))-methylthiotransferase MtaB [Sphaerochaetaceae bacterium]|jgi:threonylcarbamoyladenosine tRNA methylthiotransferase MtaB
MNVHIYTLGCKLNQCESEAIADSFTHHGFDVVNSSTPADLYIINTCTVTSKAEQKARRMIRKFASQEHHPTVLVTGCYAQMEKEELESIASKIVVVSLDDKPSLLQLPLYLRNAHIAQLELYDAVFTFAQEHNAVEVSPFEYDAASFSFHSRAFVKIQDGCDNQCAFCRVSVARGKARSLHHDDVLKRIELLQQEGLKEVVLTGVNISAYESEHIDLATLLQRLLDSIGDDVRIRLSSLEPDRLDDKLIEVCRDPRVQPHFHLPIQSASNVVLQRVNRHYDVKRLYDAFAQLRSVKDDPFIAADVIAGLPAEDDVEFEKSFEVLQQLDVSQLHVFPYSPRPQTDLYDATDRSPEYVRDQRAKRLRDLSHIHYRRYVNRHVDKQVEVILEKQHGKMWKALSSNYIHLWVEDLSSNYQRGDLVNVTLSSTFVDHLPVATA